MTQDVRAIDWSTDPTDTVVRKLRAAEGHPGVLDTVQGTQFHLFGVHRERELRGAPGAIVAQRHGAICRATSDGAVWITHLKRREGEAAFKLPATRALELAGVAVDAPEVPSAVNAVLPAEHTFREIAYEEHAGVGYLHFDFYNGAMSTEQCRRLRDAYVLSRSRHQTKVIVLMGGADFFSNGIHLNVIEAADDPALESWLNLQAIDEVVREIVETDSHLVISALAGDAAAGGVPFALAADRVVAREDVVLNPLPPHGRPLRLGVLDLPAAPPGRPRDGRPTDERAVHSRGHQRGDRDGAARRRLRRHRRRLPRPGPRPRRALRARPSSRPSPR
jgi:putative two-component system hydrogenase maturation factor HypX/HoxX